MLLGKRYTCCKLFYKALQVLQKSYHPKYDTHHVAYNTMRSWPWCQHIRHYVEYNDHITHVGCGLCHRHTLCRIYHEVTLLQKMGFLSTHPSIKWIMIVLSDSKVVFQPYELKMNQKTIDMASKVTQDTFHLIKAAPKNPIFCSSGKLQ